MENFDEPKSEAMPNPVGRPRTTVEDLPANWKEIMADCGQEGGSAVEVRCSLGIGESAWGTLLEDSEEFQQAEEQRQMLCQVWWEKQGRRMVVTGDGSASVWIFNMKNRFGMRDQPKDEGSENAGEPLNIQFEVADPVKSISITKGEKKQA